MKVPFVDLRAQYSLNQNDIRSASNSVFQAMQFVGGEEVEYFEHEFASFLGAKHIVSVNSGTDALILGIRALGFKPNDEILVPVNTFYATAVAVVQNQLKPVFVDVDETYGISLSDLARKITSRTKAVIAVHLYGQPDNIEGIQSVIKKSKKHILFLEDACQAHGAKYKGKIVGTFGIFSAFSFYPAKNLGAYGDGGAIATDDDHLAKQYKLLREYGQTKKYHHTSLGINSRLDSLQAAFLRKKLVYLSRWNTLRYQKAQIYSDNLRNCQAVITPKFLDDRCSVFHIYAIRTKKRNKLKEYLREREIETNIHYPIPLHLTQAFHYLGYTRNDFPNAEKYAQQLLSLPMYPEIPNSSIKRVTDEICYFFGEK